MRITRCSAYLALIGAVMVPATLQAQSTEPRVQLVPQVGYAVHGDLWQGPVGTRIGGRNSALYGLQAGLHLTRGLAITGNVALSDSELEAGIPVIGGAAFGSLRNLYYDAGIELSLPLGSGVSPFLQAGAGGVRHDIDTGIVDLTATSPAFHVGGGLDLPVGNALAIRLQVRDYISKFDAREAIYLDVTEGATGHTLAFTAGLRLRF